MNQLSRIATFALSEWMTVKIIALDQKREQVPHWCGVVRPWFRRPEAFCD